MCKAGFTRASVDHSVFVKESDVGNAMVTIHVDDMVAAISNLETLAHIIADLSRIIDIVDMGPIKWFLGIMVTRDHIVHTISLSQTAYIDTILKHFHMTNSHGILTPLDPIMVLSTTMSPTLEEAKQKMKGIPYLTGVGSLMYASMATCPDITFATNQLSQLNSNHGLPHWTALQHVL